MDVFNGHFSSHFSSGAYTMFIARFKQSVVSRNSWIFIKSYEDEAKINENQ